MGDNGQAVFDMHTALAKEHGMQLLLDNGRYRSLISLLEHKELSLRYPASRHFYRAEAYRLLAEPSRQPDLEPLYRQSIAEMPHFAPPHKALGLMLIKQGNVVEAKHFLRAYLQLSPAAKDKRHIEHQLSKL